jgi:2-polyprenyl-3-methyl-5-hydroxy-6-metoxy-1,4-benzoquinol methylase
MSSTLATVRTAEHQGVALPVPDPGMLKCPVCGSTAWGPAPGVRGVSLVRCAQCGLLGTTHFVTGARSTETLYDVSEENHAEYRRHYLPHRLAAYRRFLPGLEQFRKSGRLLEVGSGYGYFLEMAAKAKWDCEGVEISAYCCEIATRLGCKVRQKPLRDAGLAAETYDIVVLWDVIEHFTEPDAVVRMCRSLLRKGGALVMRTPDGRALARSLGPVRTAYRHLVYPANTAEHVFHFTPDDLSSMVTNLGFAVQSVECDESWQERVISGNNQLVLTARHLIMRYAYWRAWPYEFVLTAIKA